MRILVVGSSGFLGRHIADALVRDGHEVVRAARPHVDFTRDREEAWRGRLAGIDIAINAAGILRHGRDGTLDAVHAIGPTALFAACVAAGVKVIQVSALGADEEATTEFHRSKKRADDALLAIAAECVVLQPSLVFGADGASARLFLMLATLPVVPLPGDGRQRIQPIHVDDVAAAACAVVRRSAFTRNRLALVGPRPLSYAEYLGELRLALGLHAARFVPVPQALIKLRAADTLSMLNRGNTADASAVAALLGRAPRDPRDFVSAADRGGLAAQARAAWIAPMLRFSIASVWIVTGVVSLGVFPVEESLAMLARVGLEGMAAKAALYGAAVLDLAFGIATLVMRKRRMLWLAQGALIVAYTAIITAFLPEQWLHPFGPLLKNIPMLAAIVACYALEER